AKFQYGAWTTLQRADLKLTKSHYNDAVAISEIRKIKAKPTSIMMFKQFRKKKRSLHEATARKGRKTPNITSKRNAKNTKYAKDFGLMTMSKSKIVTRRVILVDLVKLLVISKIYLVII